ncbi:MAG: hypothetical protein GY719_25855 [bacterium]|nr:hypothetical protein [bacterium]
MTQEPPTICGFPLREVDTAADGPVAVFGDLADSPYLVHVSAKVHQGPLLAIKRALPPTWQVWKTYGRHLTIGVATGLLVVRFGYGPGFWVGRTADHPPMFSERNGRGGYLFGAFGWRVRWLPRAAE